MVHHTPDQALIAHTIPLTQEAHTMTHTILHTTDQAITAHITVDTQNMCHHMYHQLSPTPPQYQLLSMTPHSHTDQLLTMIASTMTDITILPTTDHQDIMITDIHIDHLTTHHTDHTITEICSKEAVINDKI